ncbi:MAG: hypothetical protein AAF705_15460 [Bacteroidota bacterium]
MLRKIFVAFVFFVCACSDSNNGKAEILVDLPNSVDKQSIDSSTSIELNQPTVLILTTDSIGIEKLKKQKGLENFYKAADDLMWYNSMLLQRIETLQISVLYQEYSPIFVKMKDGTQSLTKDTSAFLNTYFYYNGKQLRQVDLMNLLEEGFQKE